jgi:peptide/nickel transport system ATP-binding protein
MNQKPILEVKNLKVYIQAEYDFIKVVNSVSFTLHETETMAIVGESGSGKTIMAMSIPRLLPLQARIDLQSEILLRGKNLLDYSEKQMQAVRRNDIAVIFQDPQVALNPVLTIGEQLIEAIPSNLTKKEYKLRAIELLKDVLISEAHMMLEKYPHQLSGGQKQRVIIAMALAKSPSILIADEPTTALDVTTQAQIIELLKLIIKKNKMALILISHDLGMVRELADSVQVMYAGHMVEQASAKEFFTLPKHPYAQKLFKALPEHTDKRAPLSVILGQVPNLNQDFSLCRFYGRCEVAVTRCQEKKPELYAYQEGTQNLVRCLHYEEKSTTESVKKIAQNLMGGRDITPHNEFYDVHFDLENSQEKVNLIDINHLKVFFPIQKGLLKKTVGYIKAVDGVSLSIHEGETVALVGESGCGKSTVGKAILQLIKPSYGNVIYMGKDLTKLFPWKMRKIRSDCQMIFQDPYSSMDPRMRISDILEEGMIALNIGSNKAERQDRIDVLLEQVGLNKAMKHRFPHEFSGGQRQRICIARVLALGAKFIICDEPTSSLDVSVQAQLLNLFQALQNEFNISLLFITHNISVVSYLADTVAVMYLGRIIEQGPAEAILKKPRHPYTQALLASVPSIEGAKKIHAPMGELPSNINRPSGCHFHPRCPHVMPICKEIYPPIYALSNQTVKCFLYSDKVE